MLAVLEGRAMEDSYLKSAGESVSEARIKILHLALDVDEFAAQLPALTLLGLILWCLRGSEVICGAAVSRCL